MAFPVTLRKLGQLFQEPDGSNHLNGSSVALPAATVNGNAVITGSVQAASYIGLPAAPPSAASSLKGNNTGAPAATLDLTVAQVAALLGGTTHQTLAFGDAVASGGVSAPLGLGPGTTPPARNLDVGDGANPQIRLTNTQNSLFADLQADTSGYLVVTPSGGRVGINGAPALANFQVVGLQPAAVATTPGTAATKNVEISGGTGGNTTIGGPGSSGTAGQGALVRITAGDGGIATAAQAAANAYFGGHLQLFSGNGGAQSPGVAGTGTNTGGQGGTVTLQSGAGGAATAASSGTNTGGPGGSMNITGGVGGAANTGSGNNVGGSGGGITIRAGAGGVGISSGGGGGATVVAGGNGAAMVGAIGGNLTLNSGAGSATGSGGAAGLITIQAGNAGGDGSVNRGGGSVTVIGGNSTGTFPGANIILRGGAPGGAATARGNIMLNDTGGYVAVGAVPGGIPGVLLHQYEQMTIAGATTDGFAAGHRIQPSYTAASAQTVTRHNYIGLWNPTVTNVAVTDACVFRFDANAGTHLAVAAGSTKATPGTVQAWLKINLNGTVVYSPLYTSMTS